MRYHPFIHRVWEAVAEAGAPPRGSRMLVAVSGGVDSMVLWKSLEILAPRNGWTLAIGHVHHGLQTDATRVAEKLAALARERGVPFEARYLDPRELRDDARGLEAAARIRRYEALDEMADALGAAFVVLAHHRGDQAETVLERLTRGAGRRGMAAMAPARGRLLRPLLAFDRRFIETYAREQGLWYWRDPSNDDRRFVRNALRADILPRLEAIRPGCEAVLARAAQVAGIETAVLDELFESERAAVRVEGIAGDAIRLALLDAWSQERRIWYFHEWLWRVAAASDDGVPRFGLEDARVLADWATGAGGAELSLGGGWSAVRGGGVLEFLAPASPETVPPNERQGMLSIPGEYSIGEASLLCRQGDSSLYRERCPTRGVLDPGRLDGPLVYRPPQSDDRILRGNGPGPRTVFDLWREARVPRSLRDRIPVVCDRAGIVWAPWAGPQARAAFNPGGRSALLVEYRQAKKNRARCE